MIDYGFEDRLIERIALRETIAAVSLTAKQKRVLHYRLRGHTLAEIAKDEGLSRNRIREIFEQSARKIRHKVRATETGFDKAAFVRHMQGLVKRHAAREQQTFEYERAELERMLAREREPEPRYLTKAEVESELARLHPQPPPPPIRPPVTEWLLEALWDAGEYLQVYRYLANQIAQREEP